VYPYDYNPETLTFNDLHAVIKSEVRVMGYSDRIVSNGFNFQTNTNSQLNITQLKTPEASKDWGWVLYVSAWNGFRKSYELGNYPLHSIGEAITELARTHARILAERTFAEAFVPNCPTCGTQYDTYEYNEGNEPCGFGWCPNGKCASHDVEL
jgi:hypothetical protein